MKSVLRQKWCALGQALASEAITPMYRVCYWPECAETLPHVGQAQGPRISRPGTICAHYILRSFDPSFLYRNLTTMEYFTVRNPYPSHH